MPKKDKPSPKKRKGDYAKKVSGEIIEQIKRGTAPWQKPWKPGEVQHPENFATGKRYAGGNSLYLMSRQISEGRLLLASGKWWMHRGRWSMTSLPSSCCGRRRRVRF